MADPIVIQVGTSDELNAAIANIDAIGKSGSNTGLQSGAYVIRFTADITLGTDADLPDAYAADNPDGSAGTASLQMDSGSTATAPTTVVRSSQLYAINLSNGTTLTIDGAGHKLDGDNRYNGFFVYDGKVGIQDLTVADAVAQGGNSTAGGGGAGLGGGLFVAGTGNADGNGEALTTGGDVTLTNVSFDHDAAQGGNSDADGGFGGGGLEGGQSDYSGGGVGLGADGLNGLILGAAPGGRRGVPFGGDGGGVAGPAPGGGGGGGVGGTGGSGVAGGTGGHGGFGGGGGVFGGSGGFGGGGGSGGGERLASVDGGAGGFGGGGGGHGTGSVGGIGGFGGGDGGAIGGGGLGAGADVFVQQGGKLRIAGGTLGAGTVTGGANAGDTRGAALGSGLFIQGDQAVTLVPGAGQTTTVAGVIADEAGSQSQLVPGQGTDTGTGGTGNDVGSLMIGDGTSTGTVVLSAANTYEGATSVRSGTLLVDGSTAAASAVAVAGGATLGGAGDVAGAVTVDGTLSASAAGSGTASSIGTLTIGALTLNSDATFREDIASAASADLVAANGAVSIGGTLDIEAPAGFTSTAGQSVTLIDNTSAQATTGMFTALVLDGNAGAIVDDGFAASGRLYRIDYAADVDGDTTANDVTVTDVGAVPPTIAGLQPATTNLQDAMRPFASATVNDPAPGALDSLTIAPTGAAGTLAGAGLTANPDGTYTLAFATPQTLTQELEALTFAPLVTDDGPVETTSFALTVTSTSGASSSAATTSTVDSTPNQGQFGTTTTSASTPQGEAYALYQGLLGRAPDPIGGEMAAAALGAGAPLDRLTQGLLASPEASSFFTPGSSDGDFVSQLYGRVLGRTDSTDEQAYWDRQLAAGASRAQVADDFVFSSEHLGDIQPALSQGVFVADAASSDAARLYYGLLDRAPDADGLQHQAAALDGGASLDALARGFLSSPEYAADDPTLPGDQAFVDALFANALGRTPDQGGYWVQQLGSGAETRAQVAVGIAESAEAKQHLAGRIEAGYHLA